MAVTLLGFVIGDRDGGITSIDGKLVRSFNVILIWLRLLQLLQLSKGVGVLVIMIAKMVEDVVRWLLVSALFLAAFTVSFISIYEPPNANLEETWMTGPLPMPTWAMLGAFDQTAVSEWRDDYSASGMLWVYVMVRCHLPNRDRASQPFLSPQHHTPFAQARPTLAPQHPSLADSVVPRCNSPGFQRVARQLADCDDG